MTTLTIDTPAAKLTPRVIDNRAEYYEARRKLDLERIEELEKENAELREIIEARLD